MLLEEPLKNFKMYFIYFGLWVDLILIQNL